MPKHARLASSLPGVLSSAWVGLSLGLAAGAPGCSSSSSGDAADLAIQDLRMPPVVADLRMMPPDLALPPPDMSPPMVTGLPTDCTPGTTSVDLYNNVVAPKCIVDGCHRQQFMLWGALTASQFISAVVGVKASQAPALLRVKPGDVNGSYMIYKHRTLLFSVENPGRQGLGEAEGNESLGAACKGGSTQSA